MLCVNIATRLQEQELAAYTVSKQGNSTHSLGVSRTEQTSAEGANRPCSCVEKQVNWGRQSQSRTVFHLYVRERNAFQYLDVFVRSDDLSLAALEEAVMQRFRAVDYVPLFIKYGSQKRFTEGWRVFKIYPVLTNQRRVLFENGAFASTDEIRRHLMSTPCPRLEVIFV